MLQHDLTASQSIPLPSQTPKALASQALLTDPSNPIGERLSILISKRLQI